MKKTRLVLAALCAAALATFAEPDYYLEWLGSNSSNPQQEIDTGYVFTNLPKVVAAMYKLNGNDCDQAGTKSAFFDINYTTTGIYYRYGSGNTNPGTGGSFTSVVGRWVECVWTTNIVHDGTVVKTVNQGSWNFKDNSQSFWLFRGRTYSAVRFKYVDMYDGDILVRSFRPAVLGNSVGLWDSVTQKMYVNLGTGTFEQGPLLSDPTRLTISGSPEAYGTVSPAYGTTAGHAAGASFTAQAPADPISLGIRSIRCTGWKRYTWDADANDWAFLDEGNGTSFTYTHPDPAVEVKLEWQWETSGVATECSGPGRIDASLADGVFTLTAVPDAGAHFVCWYGGDDIPVALHTNAVLHVRAEDVTGGVRAYFVSDSGVKTPKTWTNATSNRLWNDAGNWDPAGVPTLNDAVTISLSSRTLIPDFAVAGSLTVSDSAELYLGSEFVNNSCIYAKQTDDTMPKVRGLVVDGDIVCTGAIALGGRVSDIGLACFTNMIVRAGGDVQVTGSGKLTVYAAPYQGARADIEPVELYRAATVMEIGGELRIDDSAVLYPTCDDLSGTSVKFQAATFFLGANAKVNADNRGWHWFNSNGYGGPTGYFKHPSRNMVTMAKGIGFNSTTGSGHGGLGGAADATYGHTYGYAYAPYLPGAPGGGDSNFDKSYTRFDGSVRGGGCFWLRTTGEAVINGVITAVPMRTGWDAASGGGVWLAVGSLTTGANASVSVKGADRGSGANCAGGGGRVSLALGLSDAQLDTLAAGQVPEGVIASDTLTAIATVNVFGGSTSSGRAGEGTATTVMTRSESSVTVTVTPSGPVAVTGTEPAYGAWPLEDETGHLFAAPEYGRHPEDTSWRYKCLGYVVSNATDEVASGDDTSFTFTPSGEDVTVYWKWGRREFGVELAKPENGDIRANGALMADAGWVWTAEGSPCVLEAVPDEGYEFLFWVGEMPDDGHEAACLELASEEQRAVAPVFREVAAPADYIWNGGTGDWADANQWTPANIPGPADRVTVSSGTCTVTDFAAAASLTVSGGTLKTAPTAASDMHNRARINIHGDLEVCGSGKFTFGATDGGNTAWNRLQIDGDLRLSDAGELLFSAGTRAAPYTIQTGSGFLNVGGNFTITDTAVFRPNCSGYNGGTPVVTVGRKFRIDASAMVDASVRGFGVFSDVSPNIGVGDSGTKAAGHGGRGQYGANDTTGNGGDTYDSAFAPLWPGQQNRESGTAQKVRGGGVVRVKAKTVQIDGTVSADGGVCSGGAASGGSIFLAANIIRLGPEAVLTACGTTPAPTDFGASGGGRISLCTNFRDDQLDSLLADGNTLPDKVNDITAEFLAANPSATICAVSGDRASAIDACQGTVRVLRGAKNPGTLVVIIQ